MSPLITAFAQLALGWGKSTLDMRMAEKQSLMRARHKRYMTAAKSESDWQALMADAARHSWKDEAWTICFIVIFFMCFMPQLQHHVAQGFAILQTTPDWFQWAVLASIGASFGLRGFDKWHGKSSPSPSPRDGEMR